MVRVAEDSRSCYVLGNTRKYIILREGSYYFAAIPDREEHNHSRLDGESIKSGESNSPFIAEVVLISLSSHKIVLLNFEIVK